MALFLTFFPPGKTYTSKKKSKEFKNSDSPWTWHITFRKFTFKIIADLQPFLRRRPIWMEMVSLDTNTFLKKSSAITQNDASSGSQVTSSLSNWIFNWNCGNASLQTHIKFADFDSLKLQRFCQLLSFADPLTENLSAKIISQASIG